MDLYTKDYHNRNVMSWLNSDRSNGQKFTDARLKCDGREFPVHKTILASLSVFFETMFTTEMSKKSQENFEISGVSAEKLEATLDFIYTGEIKIEEESMFDVYATANYFLMSSLEKMIYDNVVQNMSPANVLKNWNIVRDMGFEKLLETCEAYLQLHFPILNDKETIVSLDFEAIKALINVSPYDAESSEAALLHLQNWISHDLESRRTHFGDLFLLRSWENVTGGFWVDKFKLQEVCSEFPKWVFRFVEILSARYEKLLRPEPGQSILVTNKNSTCLTLFDLLTKEQKIIYTRTKPCYEAGIIVQNNCCYLVGGYADNPRHLNYKTQRINLNRPSEALEDFRLNHNRYKCGVASINDDMYVVGGAGSYGALLTPEKYCKNPKGYMQVKKLKKCKKSSVDVVVRKTKKMGSKGQLLCLNYDESTCEVYDVATEESVDIEPLEKNTLKAIIFDNKLHLLSIENNQLILKVSKSRGVYGLVEPNLVHVSKLQDACVAHGKIVVAVISEKIENEVRAEVENDGDVESSSSDTESDDVSSTSDDQLNNESVNFTAKVETALRIYERDLEQENWRFVFETTEITTYHKLIPFTIY